MSKPASLVVLGYESRAAADEALREVEQLGQEKFLDLKDAVVAVKTEQDRIELDQTRELSLGQGAVVGGVAGTLLGLALGLVTGGAAAGIVAGGAVGLLDTGIKNERLKQLAADLEPGHALLGVLIGEADWAALRERRSVLGGDPIVFELTPEAHEALERAESAAQG